MPRKIDSILIEGTYSGCYEGLPSIQQSIENAEERVNRIFGDDRPVYVVPYKTTYIRANREVLPSWRHIVWMTSDEILESSPKDYWDGSHLFLIAFTDTTQVNWEIDDETWQKHAKNFGY